MFCPASDVHLTHTQYPGSGIEKCQTDERDGVFDACEMLGPGAAYSFQFNEVGRWDYHDYLTPTALGAVVVLE